MKIAITNSGTDQAYEVHGRLSDSYRPHLCSNLSEADVVVALGGDGHMLDVLRALSKDKALSTPIYGMNLGTVGYAMNNFREDKCLIARIEAALPQSIRPLSLKTVGTNGIPSEYLAWNEGTVFRQDMQTLHVSVDVGDTNRIKDISCDGLIYATPFGSTAYNRSAGGPILPLDSRTLALTPICPNRPRDWPGAVLPQSASIHIENLDTDKRPMMVTFDSGKRMDVESVTMSVAARKKATLLFDPGHGLEDRILDAQFPF